MQITRWFDALHLCQKQGKSYVLVTLLGSMGSTPRDTGSKMVITDDSCYDTIGGGHLELQVTQQAKALLATGEQKQHLEHFPLSSKLGQCCGGATHVLYEVMVAHTQSITVYGAGHVAKSLIPILSQLPLQISWIDQREDMFYEQTVGHNVSIAIEDDPVSTIQSIAQNSWVIILTHNHQLDFDLVLHCLKRPDLDFIGMIGSDTKAKRFKNRLAHRDIDLDQINRMICPIGLADIRGKYPIEVAVSISAQIIQKLNKQNPSDSEVSIKEHWMQTKKLADIL